MIALAKRTWLHRCILYQSWVGRKQLPQKAWFTAQRASRACDLMIVAGSSLEVLPVAGLPMQAIDRGAHLLIINNSPTYLDVRADVVLHANVVDIIPAIVEQALNG